MINLSDFLPGVRLQAPGCPNAIMLDAVRKAVRELSTTNLWSEDLYKISLAAGYPEYDIEIPPDSSLRAILSAKYNGEEIDIFTSDDMDAAKSGWRDETGGTPEAIVVDSDTVVRVYPTPSVSETDAILLHAALKPSAIATTCGGVFTDWVETIEHGALARLKAMPRKSWSMREDVMFHKNEFQAGWSSAQAKVLRGRSDKPLRSQRWGNA